MNSWAIDFLIVCWITASFVLLFVFGRYSIRCWREVNVREMFARMSFFNGLVFHHIGNLTLLIWFWIKVHRGEISLQIHPTDARIVIVGCAIACFGVLYKLRIFTDSVQELVITSGLTLMLSAASLFVLH